MPDRKLQITAGLVAQKQDLRAQKGPDLTPIWQSRPPLNWKDPRNQNLGSRKQEHLLDPRMLVLNTAAVVLSLVAAFSTEPFVDALHEGFKVKLWVSRGSVEQHTGKQVFWMHQRRLLF